ncbi:MAG: DNA replication and repair protein RecF [Pelolinea sp.]|jgi:DNA replication and repair protein RecF|nr:DNA replication and repair protein RecF [Pelolinea sp.]
MYLRHISLTNFRTFQRLEVDVPEHVTVLVGNNAQGKTSFLEAINFFSTLTSVQAGKDRELINFTALEEEMPVARLVMDFKRGKADHKMEARLILGNGGNGGGRLRKEVLLDGIKRPLQHALGNFNSVVFLPQMTEIVEDGPDERRRYLDMTISQVYPGYARELSEYNQALSQRNALLKTLAERGGDAGQLDFWDERIAEKGSFIMRTRLQMLGEFEQQVSVVHLKLSENKLPLTITYLPGFDRKNGQSAQDAFTFSAEKDADSCKISQEALKAAFVEKLQTVRKDEIQRGVTTQGPHRDELRFIANQIDMGTYGSRGQIRTVLMALKIGEMHWLREKTGEWPVLLLDETLAELDLAHRDALLHALGDCEQAILTATDASMFNPDFLKTCSILKVEEGRIFA